MNCRQALDRVYEFLDKELTPEVEREVREHLEACKPCGQHYDFEQAFLTFLQARCRSRSAPPDLKRRILNDLFGE
jgi:mycothiol system anti-sigma-R factor